MADGKDGRRENERARKREGSGESRKGGREGVVNVQKSSIGISYRAGFTIGRALQRSAMSVGK
jgi:hypothetical protein